MNRLRDPGSSLEALLFDAGNTLVEMDYDRIRSHLDPEDRFCQETEGVREAEQSVRPALDAFLSTGVSTETLRTFSRYLEMIADKLGVSDSPGRQAAIQSLFQHHQESNLWSRQAPFARETLEELRRSGVRVGVVSNSGGSIDKLLEKLGLASFLDVIVDSAIVGVEKPDPGIFSFALDRLGLKSSRTAYVGDLFSVDVLGARSAGLLPILLDPVGAWGMREGCLLIPDLTALVPALRDSGHLPARPQEP